MLKGESTINGNCREVTYQPIGMMVIVLAHSDISFSTRLIVSAFFTTIVSWVGTERIDVLTPGPFNIIHFSLKKETFHW